MSKQTEALKLALEDVYETIIQWDEGGGKRSRRELARRIVALAEQPAQQEPVAWMWMLDGEVWDLCSTKDRFTPIREGHIQMPLYTSPPVQRTLVGLTDKEIDDLYCEHHDEYGFQLSATGYERAIEAKLKEKNA